MASLGRVLVVEDEPQVALLLHDALQDFGYEVRVAVNGHEALAWSPTISRRWCCWSRDTARKVVPLRSRPFGASRSRTAFARSRAHRGGGVPACRSSRRARRRCRYPKRCEKFVA